MSESLPSEILQLPISDRLNLVEKIWDSIADDESRFQLTEAQKQELDRRLNLQTDSPVSGSTWQEVKSRLLGQS